MFANTKLYLILPHFSIFQVVGYETDSYYLQELHVFKLYGFNACSKFLRIDATVVLNCVTQYFFLQNGISYLFFNAIAIITFLPNLEARSIEIKSFQ